MDRAGWVALAGPPGHCAEEMRPGRHHLGSPSALASAAIVQAALASLDAQRRSNGERVG